MSNYKELINTLRTDYVTLEAVFKEGGTPYLYKALRSQNIWAGDSVVVVSPSGLAVVTVVQVHTIPNLSAGKWIVQKVDTDTHTQLINNEEAVTKLLEKRNRDKAMCSAIAAVKDLGEDTYLSVRTLLNLSDFEAM